MPKSRLFTPSKRPSHLEILSVLESNPPGTVSVIAIGPLTNIALAAAEDAKTLCRAKELIIMGGALREPGNITPLAEFNVYADSFAAARVFALTSPIPASTMPPKPPIPQHESDSDRTKRLRDLPDYPPLSQLGDQRLNIVLFPLDCTSRHEVFRHEYLSRTKMVREKGSPLAEWHDAIMRHTFQTMENLHLNHSYNSTFVVLHDAVCIWYALNASSYHNNATASEKKEAGETDWALSPPIDIRIDSAGQWSRGACIVDRRDRKMRIESQEDAEALGPIKSDDGAWLSDKRGNRVRVCNLTPGRKAFVDLLWGRIFSL